MALADRLIEAQDIKALLLTATKESLASGALLGYTTNGTKIVYESAVKTAELLRKLNDEIATIEANIAHVARF